MTMAITARHLATVRCSIPDRALLKNRPAAAKRINHQPSASVGLIQQICYKLRRELPAPAENVAPRLVGDVQFLTVKRSHGYASV
jgi:hypothetical protein